MVINLSLFVPYIYMSSFAKLEGSKNTHKHIRTQYNVKIRRRTDKYNIAKKPEVHIANFRQETNKKVCMGITSASCEVTSSRLFVLPTTNTSQRVRCKMVYFRVGLLQQNFCHPRLFLKLFTTLILIVYAD